MSGILYVFAWFAGGEQFVRAIGGNILGVFAWITWSRTPVRAIFGFARGEWSVWTIFSIAPMVGASPGLNFLGESDPWRRRVPLVDESGPWRQFACLVEE